MTLAAPAQAQAWLAMKCEALTGISVQNATVDIGTTVQVGQPLGPWLAVQENEWRCKRVKVGTGSSNSAAFNIVFTFKPQVRVTGGNVSSGTFLTVDGETYRVYRVNTSGQEVGYIARARRTGPGVGIFNTYWEPVTKPVGTTQQLSDLVAEYTSAGHYYNVKVEVQVRMVKTRAEWPTANKIFDFSAVNSGLVTSRTSVAGWPISGTDTHTEQPFDLRVTFSQAYATCTTPNLNVQLPTVDLAHYPSVGSVGKPEYLKNFELLLQNCPAYLNGITWRVEAPGSAWVSNGTLPLQSPSTAAGLGVQVLYPDNTPLAFYSPHNLFQYNPSQQNATYTVPLKARVVRTDSYVAPGSIQTSMLLKLTYQ